MTFDDAVAKWRALPDYQRASMLSLLKACFGLAVDKNDATAYRVIAAAMDVLAFAADPQADLPPDDPRRSTRARNRERSE